MAKCLWCAPSNSHIYCLFICLKNNISHSYNEQNDSTYLAKNKYVDNIHYYYLVLLNMKSRYVYSGNILAC